MNNDQPTRSARQVATLVALPIAVVAGFVAFQALQPSAEPIAKPSASASPRVAPSTPIEVPVNKLDDRQATVCRALLSRLPDTLRNQPRRQVIAGHEQAAAYGEPATIISCGAVLPTFGPTERVFPVTGVCWYASKAGAVWTTVDREVPIAVQVPAAEAGNGSGQWAAALAAIITGSVPSSTTAPGGCTG